MNPDRSRAHLVAVAPVGLLAVSRGAQNLRWVETVARFDPESCRSRRVRQSANVRTFRGTAEGGERSLRGAKIRSKT